MPDPASKKKDYTIDFLCEGNIESFPWKDKFEAMARKLLAEEGTENNVNIVLCTDEFVREINKNYRGLDKVTDVLSFEWHEEIPGEEEMLGEIYIARDQVKRQAPQYGNSFFADQGRRPQGDARPRMRVLGTGSVQGQGEHGKWVIRTPLRLFFSFSFF